MKTIFFFILLFVSILSSAQDRLSFIKNSWIKEEVQKSVDYLNNTKVIPLEIRSKVIFITFDFDDIFDEAQTEIMGINYSTYIPTLLAKLNKKEGQFKIDEKFRVMYYNYSTNIVFVFFKGDKYFDQNQMKQLSNEVQVVKENLTKSEFFKYEKGNSVTLDAVENFISLEKKDNKFVPIRVNTFDLKTFMEVWYGVDVKEIPVSNTKDKVVDKKNSADIFHTHPE
ncbi:hypothetical protein MKJ01_18570 [Chryseobacterium sp. SSA4.19]|uniref:hypothetical protein n=1 Tax=Chryseobacterium sp. SSA4.19 TaxID=2919915 RepID=UPI001F4EF8DB|nr:hypothetical protein [Chryseobacterium sp. SSA4.19]MCJ8155762.1 hypothetical protein [Chryseobacterium sp. SSA4.19]